MFRRVFACAANQPFKAIVCETFGAPEVMKLAQRAPLAAPAANQVMIQVHAAGVNPSDTYIRLGPAGPYAGNKKLIPELPFTPGKDGAGVVVAVGSGVTSPALQEGKRVYVSGSISGTTAEYSLCDAGSVYALPDNISYAAGACVGVPCATAYRSLFDRCRAAAGSAVLIHGASGGVGLAATQLAASAGCVVVGTAGTAAGMDLVKQAGAAAVVNHREEGYLARAAEALPADKNGKFDVVLEMAADRNLAAAVSACGPGGVVGIVGSLAKPAAINPRLLMAPESSIIGCFLGSSTPAQKTATHAALYEAMAAGKLNPVVGKIVSLADAPQSHVEVMAPPGGGAVGNIVIEIVPGSSKV